MFDIIPLFAPEMEELKIDESGKELKTAIDTKQSINQLKNKKIYIKKPLPA